MEEREMVLLSTFIPVLPPSPIWYSIKFSSSKFISKQLHSNSLFPSFNSTTQCPSQKLDTSFISSSVDQGFYLFSNSFSYSILYITLAPWKRRREWGRGNTAPNER